MRFQEGLGILVGHQSSEARRHLEVLLKAQGVVGHHHQVFGLKMAWCRAPIPIISHQPLCRICGGACYVHQQIQLQAPPPAQAPTNASKAATMAPLPC